MVAEVDCTIGVNRVEQGMRPLGMLRIGIRIRFARVVMAMLSGFNDRVICGV